MGWQVAYTYYRAWAATATATVTGEARVTDVENPASMWEANGETGKRKQGNRKRENGEEEERVQTVLSLCLYVCV